MPKGTENPLPGGGKVDIAGIIESGGIIYIIHIGIIKLISS